MDQALVIGSFTISVLGILVVWVAHSAVVRAKDQHIADLQAQIAWFREDDDDDDGEDCGLPPWVGSRPTVLMGPN